MSKSLTRVIAALEAAGIGARVLEMPESTRTAAEAAQAAGCEIDQIAKSIIFRGETSGKVRLFITAGGNQVDAGKASAVADRRCSADSDRLISFTPGCSCGSGFHARADNRDRKLVPRVCIRGHAGWSNDIRSGFGARRLPLPSAAVSGWFRGFDFRSDQSFGGCSESSR